MPTHIVQPAVCCPALRHDSSWNWVVARYNYAEMPAKDKYHDTVVAVLQKEGWTVTHDPLTLRYGRREVFVDLGAEQIFAAERGTERIAVEVESFIGDSEWKICGMLKGSLFFTKAFWNRSNWNESCLSRFARVSTTPYLRNPSVNYSWKPGRFRYSYSMSIQKR